ncbi:MAG TPA: SDR family NAD(P)-dependent oxidoreductase, partial [Solimonas sp.]
MKSKVQGQVIVITGASKGIGFATAQVLASRGAKVALLARGEAGLKEAAAQLPAGQVFTAAVDVCDKAGMEKALDAVIAKWGRIDGIINNAGFQFARRIELMP